MANYNVCYTRNDVEFIESPEGTIRTLPEIKEYLSQDARNAVIFIDSNVFLARCADDTTYYTANYPPYEPDDVISENIDNLEQILAISEIVSEI